jgi:hypothetical protein
LFLNGSNGGELKVAFLSRKSLIYVLFSNVLVVGLPCFQISS